MEMAEQHMEQETIHVHDNDEEETGDGNGNEEMNGSLLAGLNLVLIMSFLSLSAEDCSSLDEIQEMPTDDLDHRHKDVVSRSSFQTRKQQVNQVPAVERQTPRVQTKIRDFRHNRRF